MGSTHLPRLCRLHPPVSAVHKCSHRTAVLTSFLLLSAAPGCALVHQMSKGFAVSVRSLWARQCSRQLLQRLLSAERAKGAHLGSSLEGKDARLHDLDATVSKARALPAWLLGTLKYHLHGMDVLARKR